VQDAEQQGGDDEGQVQSRVTGHLVPRLIAASTQRKAISSRSTRRPTIAAGPRSLLASLPARALQRVVHGGQRDLQLLGQGGRPLATPDLLRTRPRLAGGELAGPPALPGSARTGPRRTRGPPPPPTPAPSPAGAPERVVHGGERDLQLLGQRGGALPALDL